MSLSILVVDTSYLLEVYRVPDYFDAASADEIKSRFARAFERGSRIYVPFSVIFEMGNHIVDVRNGKARHQLAQRFAKDVRTSVDTDSPWIVTPAGGRQVLLELSDLIKLCERFAADFAPERVGLTDTSLIIEAERLKRDRYPHADQKVHIWTKDHRLKAHEPDAEADPYLGS